MKKINMISRIILSIIVFILFSIFIMNEDSSWIIIPIIFSVITFGLSFPSTIFAQKIIKIGDKINNKLLKVLYYILLLIILLVLCLVIYFIIINIYDKHIIHPNEFMDALDIGLLLLFIIYCLILAVVLPYFQAIIINILKKYATIKK